MFEQLIKLFFQVRNDVKVCSLVFDDVGPDFEFKKNRIPAALAMFMNNIRQ